jgi:hypothetical protein
LLCPCMIILARETADERVPWRDDNMLDSVEKEGLGSRVSEREIPRLVN